METIYIENLYWRTMQVEKKHWLYLISQKKAKQILKPATSYNNTSKIEVMKLLDKAKIEYDELSNKADLIKLLPN